MNAHRWCRAGVLAAVVGGGLGFGWGCGSNSVEPAGSLSPASYGPGDVYIEVQVTGGIAVTDYAFAVDGSARVVRGISCRQLCNFVPNEELLHLSAAQVMQLTDLLVDAGVLDADGKDFGVQCCDQHHFAVEARIGDRESRFQGSSEALPSPLKEAVLTLGRLLRGEVPAIVAFDSQPSDWPRDDLALHGYSVAGDDLSLEVQYNGGCAGHVFDLVAYGGWMESSPVQVKVLLAHDNRSDSCGALLTREVEFDLGTLRDAYIDSYGAGPRWETTIILRLTAPDGGEPRQIEYHF